uniref:Uncharacterized protein n=1 Tax=Brugia timori TaxID=42155 RepID=A0A0R3Q574_9BILA
MIEYLSVANDDKGLLKKSEEVQFRILDFVTLQFFELIGHIVGKAHLRKALHRWISVRLYFFECIFCLHCETVNEISFIQQLPINLILSQIINLDSWNSRIFVTIFDFHQKSKTCYRKSRIRYGMRS